MQRRPGASCADRYRKLHWLPGPARPGPALQALAAGGAWSALTRSTVNEKDGRARPPGLGLRLVAFELPCEVPEPRATSWPGGDLRRKSPNLRRATELAAS